MRGVTGGADQWIAPPPLHETAGAPRRSGARVRWRAHVRECATRLATWRAGGTFRDGVDLLQRVGGGRDRLEAQQLDHLAEAVEITARPMPAFPVSAHLPCPPPSQPPHSPALTNTGAARGGWCVEVMSWGNDEWRGYQQVYMDGAARQGQPAAACVGMYVGARPLGGADGGGEMVASVCGSKGRART